MPVENSEPIQPEQPHDDWQQLAHDAANHWQLEHPGVEALYEGHVVPQLQSRGLGHLAITKEDRAAGRFLRKYSDIDRREVDHVVAYLHQNGETIPDKVGDHTAAYLNFMADTVNDGILTGAPESVEHQIDTHVIKAEDVPENYFALQRRIARERGHGNVEITSEARSQLIEAAQADQRGSLEKWVEYLGGDDGSYPNWFKRYTWDSVIKLGAYDKEKAKFSGRDKSTVAPYPELNREAYAYVYDTVKKFHVLGETVEDAQLKQMLKEGSFGRLYAHAIMKATPDDPELRTDGRGSWTLFNATSDSRTARRLSGSLQGHGTGWCTAGESTAVEQLSVGDFYVFYTRDEDGKDTIPRIAIRMQGGEVAEVRGVEARQELESIMVDTASEKLQGLPGGEKYTKRADDMKRLTALDHLLAEDPHAELSAEDVAFLYEVDHDIEGFGYEKDPRIKELQLKAINTNVVEALEGLQAPPRLMETIRTHIHVHELIDKASEHPEIEFSDAELRFIYGLDGPISTMDPNKGNFGSTIDDLHDCRDRERLIALAPEALAEQYKIATAAYRETARILGVEAADETVLQREIAAKIAKWEAEGAYEYMVEQLIGHNTQFSLVVTPNIVASYDQIYNAFMEFDQEQPGAHEAYFYEKLYEGYTAEELSGTQEEGASVRLSLIPNKLSSGIEAAPVEKQLISLARLRQRLPNLTLRVPSVLDAIAYWQTLRSRDGKLFGKDTYSKTFIRHLDLKPKHFISWPEIPSSFVNLAGQPELNGSRVETSYATRVSVG